MLIRDAGPWVFGGIQVAFVGSLLVRVVKGRGINLPELLIVAASVSLHWVAVMSVLHPPPGEEAIGHYALVPLVTTLLTGPRNGARWTFFTLLYLVALLVMVDAGVAFPLGQDRPPAGPIRVVYEGPPYCTCRACRCRGGVRDRIRPSIFRGLRFRRYRRLNGLGI